HVSLIAHQPHKSSQMTAARLIAQEPLVRHQVGLTQERSKKRFCAKNNSIGREGIVMGTLNAGTLSASGWLLPILCTVFTVSGFSAPANADDANGTFLISPRESKLLVETRTPTAYGEARGYVSLISLARPTSTRPAPRSAPRTAWCPVCATPT